MTRTLLTSKAQNIIEFIVLFAVVVAFMLTFLKPGSNYSSSVKKVLELPESMIDNAKEKGY